MDQVASPEVESKAKSKAPRRKKGQYTEMGFRIIGLAENQTALAASLELTQQSVSAKLTGKVTWTLKDLEKITEVYGVPMSFLMELGISTPEDAKNLLRIAALDSKGLNTLADRIEAKLAKQAAEPAPETPPEPEPEPEPAAAPEVPDEPETTPEPAAVEDAEAPPI